MKKTISISFATILFIMLTGYAQAADNGIITNLMKAGAAQKQ